MIHSKNALMSHWSRFFSYAPRLMRSLEMSFTSSQSLRVIFSNVMTLFFMFPPKRTGLIHESYPFWISVCGGQRRLDLGRGPHRSCSPPPTFYRVPPQYELKIESWKKRPSLVGNPNGHLTVLEYDSDSETGLGPRVL